MTTGTFRVPKVPNRLGSLNKAFSIEGKRFNHRFFNDDVIPDGERRYLVCADKFLPDH